MGDTERIAAAIADPERYRSYLLRLWRESPDAPWRVHVHCVQSGVERRFAGLAGLFQFLDADASEAQGLLLGSCGLPER